MGKLNRPRPRVLLRRIRFSFPCLMDTFVFAKQYKVFGVWKLLTVCIAVFYALTRFTCGLLFCLSIVVILVRQRT